MGDISIFFFFFCRVAWRQHCQGDTDSYTADCFHRMPEVTESGIKTGAPPTTSDLSPAHLVKPVYFIPAIWEIISSFGFI